MGRDAPDGEGASVTDRFNRCLAVILQAEGGYSENPQDPGGATNLGITQRALSDWIGSPATIDQVKALTPDSVAPIYEAHYWDAISGADLPTGVDLIAFDCAVNQGPGIAARFLQEAAGAPVDGVVGPHTIAALKTAPAASLVAAITVLRRERYEATANFATFGAGWLRRLDEVSSLATQDAGRPLPT